MSFNNEKSNGSSLGGTSAFGNPQHSSYKWWVLANIMIGTFMAVLDSTIVNVSLPRIMAAFGITVDKAEWVINGYLLAFAVMLPSSGWLADHFGYKRMYMLALFLFTSGSFLCGLAWNENALIAFRVIQGLGGGIITPVGMAIVLREFPHDRRGTALGFWAIAAASSVSFGPLDRRLSCGQFQLALDIRCEHSRRNPGAVCNVGNPERVQSGTCPLVRLRWIHFHEHLSSFHFFWHWPMETQHGTPAAGPRRLSFHVSRSHSCRWSFFLSQNSG